MRVERHDQFRGRHFRPDPQIQCVVAHQRLATRKLLQEVHEAGTHLYVWTVNRRSQMLRLAEWGVDGIISDRTGLLARTLRPCPWHEKSVPE